jgi:putative SOS response-associated peptidase YedK
MCGRYALHARPEVIALQFGLESVPQFAPRYNIAPAAEVLVVRGRRAELARWGMRGKFANLRAETVRARFKDSWRCIVPASGFYEWQPRAGRKQPFYFYPRRDALFGFAGLWERESCTLITTEPNSAMEGIHDRMPLILAKESYAAWLAGEEDTPASVPASEMGVHPVGMAVNQAANDSPALIAPVELERGLFD